MIQYFKDTGLEFWELTIQDKYRVNPSTIEELRLLVEHYIINDIKIRKNNEQTL